MNSVMDDYELMQQMQQAQQGGAPQGQQPQMQQPSREQSNPLGLGATRAVEAAKRSLQMNEEESKRAFGRSMMHFFGAIGQQANNNPQPGFSGALGRINAGMLPAMNAYEEERDRIAKQNWEIQKYQKELETQAKKEAMERERMNHHMEMQKRNLEINQGYYGLEKQKHEDEKKEWDAISSAPGRIPLAHFKSPSMQKYVQTYIDKKTEEGQHAWRMKENIKTLEGIYERDPDISNHMSSLIMAAQQSDPSILRQQIIASGIPEHKRAEYEIAAKSFAALSIDGIKALGPVRGNMFNEKLINQSVPGAHMSGTAVKSLLKKMARDADHTYNDAHKVYKAYEEGFFEKVKPRSSLEEEVEGEEGSAPQQGAGIASHYSTEQLMKMRQMQLKQSGIK